MSEVKDEKIVKPTFHIAFTEVHDGDKVVPIIAVGTMDENKAWAEANEATNEAIEAVRDYFFSQYKDEDKIYGFQWKRNDGKVVKLVLTVDETDKTDTVKSDEAST